MRLQLLLPSLAATALAEFQYKAPPGGVMPGCSDTVSGPFDVIRAAPAGLKKRDAIYPYEGQVRHSLMSCAVLTPSSKLS
jgi:hypothetical protein